MIKNISTVIWDWNGTLLNDVDLCIESMNDLLKKRHLPILDRTRYLEVFTFPVIDYYKILGFDFTKEPFDIPALEFIEAYSMNFPKCTLQDGAGRALNYFSEINITQYVLSAMEQEELLRTIGHFSIQHFFREMIGISDHFASGKIEKAKEFIQKESIDLKNTLFIGDSQHDHEVAVQLGCHCVLITNGHQPSQKLEKTGRPLFKNLDELINHFKYSKTE